MNTMPDPKQNIMGICMKSPQGSQTQSLRLRPRSVLGPYYRKMRLLFQVPILALIARFGKRIIILET